MLPGVRPGPPPRRETTPKAINASATTAKAHSTRRPYDAKPTARTLDHRPVRGRLQPDVTYAPMVESWANWKVKGFLELQGRFRDRRDRGSDAVPNVEPGDSEEPPGFDVFALERGTTNRVRLRPLPRPPPRARRLRARARAPARS